MDTPYIPIPCDIHDQLLTYATLRQQCTIAYRGDDDRVMSVEDWVVDVYTEADAEYIKLQSGAVFRLDLLVKAQSMDS